MYIETNKKLKSLELVWHHDTNYTEEKENVLSEDNKKAPESIKSYGC